MAKDTKTVVKIDSNNNSGTVSESPEDIVNMIDNLMSNGTSRLKINISDTVESGQMNKEYHHGRCDINSPFACGSVFDLLDE